MVVESAPRQLGELRIDTDTGLRRLSAGQLSGGSPSSASRRNSSRGDYFSSSAFVPQVPPMFDTKKDPMDFLNALQSYLAVPTPPTIPARRSMPAAAPSSEVALKMKDWMSALQPDSQLPVMTAPSNPPRQTVRPRANSEGNALRSHPARKSSPTGLISSSYQSGPAKATAQSSSLIAMLDAKIAEINADLVSFEGPPAPKSGPQTVRKRAPSAPAASSAGRHSNDDTLPSLIDISRSSSSSSHASSSSSSPSPEIPPSPLTGQGRRTKSYDQQTGFPPQPRVPSVTPTTLRLRTLSNPLSTLPEEQALPLEVTALPTSLLSRPLPPPPRLAVSSPRELPTVTKSSSKGYSFPSSTPFLSPPSSPTSPYISARRMDLSPRQQSPTQSPSSSTTSSSRNSLHVAPPRVHSLGVVSSRLSHASASSSTSSSPSSSRAIPIPYSSSSVSPSYIAPVRGVSVGTGSQF
ncbi:hypothetical protein DFS34DRAFT_589284 [Phlyctochytrium arcticum]|nr:hypothetical protein DFS34DRAFT_589284 [Phlyctochytrium arcticum]